MVELSTLISSIFNKPSKSPEKYSRIKFYRSNLDLPLSLKLNLLPEILPNILEIIATWGRWLEVVVVKLPDIMSGSITYENILSSDSSWL